MNKYISVASTAFFATYGWRHIDVNPHMTIICFALAFVPLTWFVCEAAKGE